VQVVDRRKALSIPPVWRLAFRPFFLAGAVFALLVVPLWVMAWTGLWPGFQPTGGWLAWHRHEMLFGFAMAIVAGFLLTAVQTWTGQVAPSGKPLMGLALLLLLPPLLAVIVEGVNRNLPAVLAQPVLWQAVWTSLRIAMLAGLLCVILTMMLLWSSRELRARGQPRRGQALELSGMLILAMPGIVLATGFFLLLNNSVGLPTSADGIVIFTNALMAIPYAQKVLDNPMRDITARYSLLCESLGMRGFSRLRGVELRALRRPLAQALAFACVLSIGDFGVVALFGNEEFRTLPFYLYQQIGAYRSQDGAVTALILLALCFALFTVIEKLPGRHAKTD